MKIKLLAGLSVVALLSSALTACGGNPNKSENPEDFFVKPTEGERAFSSVTSFDEEVDFHTENQRAFLESEKPYDELTADEIKVWSKGGNDEVSLPEKTRIEFEQDPGADFSKYVLEISTDYKFETGVKSYETTDSKKYVDVVNLYSGMNHYYRVKAIYNDETYAISKTQVLKTVEGIRNLNIDGMTNCRDMGGKRTVDGGYIKQGLLYRTAAMDDGQSGSIIKEAGKPIMLDDLGVKTEIELRGDRDGLQRGEAQNRTDSVLGDAVSYKFVPFAYEGGKNLLFRNIEPVRKAFDVLGEPSNYPIFFHCRIGTDRTGLIALLVNALCGLDEQSIYQDYLFSNFGKIGKTMGVVQSNEDSMYGYTTELKSFPTGEKLQNKAYNFLLSIGVPAEKLNNVINTLTTEGAVKGNNVDTFLNVDAKDFTAIGSSSFVDNSSLDSVKITRQPIDQVKISNSGDGLSFKVNANKATSADLYANLLANVTNLNLKDVVSVSVNGTELDDIPSISFATNALGFGTSADYWIPTKLSGISLNKGENTIEITTKTAVSKGLSVSRACLVGIQDSAKVTVAK